jgi:phosphoglucosamine mutase
MLTALFLLEAVQEKGKTLSGMTEGFTQFPQILVNVKVREKLPFERLRISDAAREIESQLAIKSRFIAGLFGSEVWRE